MSAGIDVTIGVREVEAREVIEDFACLVQEKRPLVVIKAAVTLDGRIASRSGDSKWITGEEARREAHRLRDRADAVMVGIGTVLADDPSLDVRMVPGRNPIRVVLDSELRTPTSAKVVTSSASAATWIVHGPHASADRRGALSAAGVVLIEAPLVDDSIDLTWTLCELGRRDIMRLLVEGGGQVHGSLFEQGLGDRAEIFVAPLILGDREGKPLADIPSPPHRIADAFRLTDLEIDLLGRDVRFRGRIRRPDAPRGREE
jgi:diaminohydroxyphosphoribosylaminopyrimidine deaminase/5-amino-6-(5-phosphoribosylamino)uracil reductase